jgi:radical SAM superfamily enzyme YgiQ (UPF0313 family)
MKDTPHIVLINPWIHDFAAYDFWSKPIGLLYLASILRFHDCRVSYIDCLDRFHPRAAPVDPSARFGRGAFLKTPILKPTVFAGLPRNYSRYGIDAQWFREDLQSLPKPDLILVTSLMTYWYQGVQATIKLIKALYPTITLLLGGVYATLCHRHASETSGADRVIPGPGEHGLLDLVNECTGSDLTPKFDPDDLDTYPYPAFELQHTINYVPLLTSRGCPFSCTYCASHILSKKRMVRNPLQVVEEIEYWHKRHGVDDFIFYDDALLVDAERHAIPLFEAILAAGLNLRFHTPNAVHIRGITKKTARLMWQAGFKTIRLGLETATFEHRDELDAKVNAQDFKKAVTNLKDVGFQKNQIGAYLLVGLPGQRLDSIIESIKIVKHNRITPVLAYYSPIPQTAIWDKAVACSRYDLATDPIFTNNAVLPCQSESFSWETVSFLKNLAAA